MWYTYGDTPNTTPPDGTTPDAPELTSLLTPTTGLDVNYDASTESIFNPSPPTSKYDVMSTPICEDIEHDDIDQNMVCNDDVTVERMHSTESRSVVIHNIAEDVAGHPTRINGINSFEFILDSSWHDDTDDTKQEQDTNKIIVDIGKVMMIQVRLS